MQEQQIWILNHPNLLYSQGILCGACPSNPHLFLVKDTQNQEFSIKPSEVLRIRSNIHCLSGDLLDLEDLNQQTLLFNIRQRFHSQKIYSSIGTPILVAVNPYQQLPIYTPFVKLKFCGLAQEELIRSDPHIFKTAELSYRKLVESGQSQNIIITGESGAGKTESTKFILDYLASREKRTLSHTLSGEDLDKSNSQMDTLEKRILLANPVLEAFGNAKTLRNDNSSRFGKYIEIFFSHFSEDSLKQSLLSKKMKIEGARINNYLLENSRIDGQGGNEQNYHVFYILLAKAGRDENFAREFHLDTQTGYQNVNVADEMRSSGFWETKAAEFEDLMGNFHALQFAKNEVDQVFRIVAGIMNLSNISILEAGHNKCQIDENDRFFDACLELLGISRETLSGLICCKSIKDPMTKQILHIPVAIQKARTNRNTLSKMIYNQLFDWLIFKVNRSISGNKMVSTEVSFFEIFDVPFTHQKWIF